MSDGDDSFVVLSKGLFEVLDFNPYDDEAHEAYGEWVHEYIVCNDAIKLPMQKLFTYLEEL